jgi:hypothetical protein
MAEEQIVLYIVVFLVILVKIVLLILYRGNRNAIKKIKAVD